MVLFAYIGTPPTIGLSAAKAAGAVAQATATVAARVRRWIWVRMFVSSLIALPGWEMRSIRCRHCTTLQPRGNAGHP
ncbi:hypothetical protein D3C75_1041160 [compost metagenome]